MAKKSKRSKLSRKQRAEQARAAARAAKPATSATTSTPKLRAVPARDPVFWFGYEIAWAKLVTARVVLFGLLALDAFLQIRHAPRYGTGFNVAQLPWIDALAPVRFGYEGGQLVAAYLFVLAALGVATRVVIPVVAATYAWLYFGSHLDTYQHHYLVALVLVIACFVPWQRPADAEPGTPVRTWAIRLLLVQLAIMYLWAAISKMNAAWIDGRTLGLQMTGSIRGMIDSTIGIKAVSILVIGVELTLAATVWSRRCWRIAAPLGLLFHVAIASTTLEIGLFAYLMLGLYVLVVPDRVWVRLAGTAPIRALRAVARWLVDRPSWSAIVVGLGVAGLLVIAVRLENAVEVALVLSIVPVGLAVYAMRQRTAPRALIGIAHAIAIGFWLIADRASDVASDYYRFWGGSQRRLGNLSDARYAYAKYVEIAPDEAAPHYQLGRVLLLQDNESGLASLHEAQRLEPSRARAFVEEARWLAKHGRTAEALDKAKQGTFAEPGHADAKALADSLGKGGGAEVPAATEVDP